MSQLIPFQSQTAEDLDAKLSTTMFRSTTDFIQFYNSGMINKNDETVSELATEVDATFKNVKLQGKNLVFISRVEVEIDEAIAELKKWEIAVKVKDRLSKLVEESVVSEDTIVAFLPDSPGVLHALRAREDGGHAHEKLLDEKFFRPAEEDLIEAFHAEHSSSDEPNHFLVSDFVELDDAFISEVYTTVFSK